MNEHTPKHFVLQLGSLASLYLSISFLLVLIFGIINLKFPDPSESYYSLEAAASGVRLGIAMLIVFAPTYLLLTRAVNKNRRENSDGAYLGLTKWLIYLSLLVGGGALLVDLVVIIMTFLEGEITQRFLLKSFALLLIVGAAFHYYLLDARGYWKDKESKSVMFGVGMIVVVLAAIGYGFGNIEAPAEVREGKIDELQITDLQQIQYSIEDYAIVNQMLPESLEDLPLEVPVAPEGRPAYSYNLTDTGFELCATFATASKSDVYPRNFIDSAKEAVIMNPYDWEHAAGDVCFQRRTGNFTDQE